MRAIQSEWIFIQRVNWDTGYLFAGVKKMISKTFFSSSSLRKYKNPLPRRRSYKYDASKEIWNENPESSDVSSGEVLMIHARERRTGTGRDGRKEHLWTLSEEWRDGKKAQDVAYESRLKGLVSNLQGTDKRLLLRAKITGAWMSVRVTTVSGTVLSTTEFRDFKCARYNFSPVNPQSHCDGCGTAFGVTHTLSCIIGGPVIAHHKEIRDKIIYLYRRAFT